MDIEALKMYWIQRIDPMLNDLYGTNIMSKEECGWSPDSADSEQLQTISKRMLLIFNERTLRFENEGRTPPEFGFEPMEQLRKDELAGTKEMPEQPDTTLQVVNYEVMIIFYTRNNWELKFGFFSNSWVGLTRNLR